MWDPLNIISKEDKHDPLGIIETSEYDPLGIIKQEEPIIDPLKDIEPLPEADVSPYAPKELMTYAGKQLLGAGETALAVQNMMVLYPASKLYGLMALPFGADVARQAEQDIMGAGYQPFGEAGKGAVDLIGTGFEAYLTPSRMAEETIEALAPKPVKAKYDPLGIIEEDEKWYEKPSLLRETGLPEIGAPVGKALKDLGAEMIPRIAWLAGTVSEIMQLSLLGGLPVKAKQVKGKLAVRKAIKEGASIKSLLKNRRASTDKGILDSEIYVRDIERKFTKEELDAIPYLIQKIKDPEVLKQIGREDLVPIIQRILSKKKIPSKTEFYQTTKKTAYVKDVEGNIYKAQTHPEAYIKMDESGKTPAEYPEAGWEIDGHLFKDDPVNPINLYKEYTKHLKDITPELLKQAKKVSKYYAESYKFLSENWDEVGFVKDYVTHVWDIPKARKSKVVNYFATRNPFMREKKIPSLEEGIKLGLTPKTTNIVDLLRIYDQYKIKTVHNRKFADNLKKFKDEDGNPLVMSQGKAPVDWVKIDHPAINKAVRHRVKDVTYVERVPVKVHPDIANEVKIVFDAPFSHKAVSAYETINALTKKSMLSLSFFHHFALTESAFSTGIGLKALKMWNPWEIYKQVKSKNFEIYKQQKLAKDAIDHAVTFGALEDVHRGVVENTLKSVEEATGSKAAKLVRKANQLWDTTLWDYYHNNLKLYAYEANVAKALKSERGRLGRALTPEEITAIKTGMGKFVNDSFGGQNWDLNPILGTPKMRQMMQWVLLAPDWTLSTIKQAAAPVRGTIKAVQGKPGGAALAKQGTLFWARAALYYNIVAQTANYYNTKKEYGEGRFTWENAPGHELNIFAGRNKDGTERYLRMGKQFREILEWGLDPLKKFGAKMSPALREIFRQLSAREPGGFPTEWAEEDSFWKTVIPRAKSIVEAPLPFSLRPYIQDRPVMFMFALPASKGMTNYKAVKLFKKAIVEEDKQKIRRIYFATLENNLDASSLFTAARSAVKSDITYNDREMARDILKELKQLKPEERQDAFDLYQKRGILTEGIVKQLNKLLEKEVSIRKQKQIFKYLQYKKKTRQEGE